jgi:hypothetical protein
MTKFNASEIPYFAWDRAETAEDIRRRLRTGAETEWRRTAAWILREATPSDVWQFLSPPEVFAALPALEPLLGRKRDFWIYILNKWHELGKF